MRAWIEAAAWLLSVLAAIACRNTSLTAAEMKVPIEFHGGHATDRRDGGRPVVLVAAALGVKPDIFREAFRGVTPARGGPPTREQAQRNKRALLRVLEPRGVTNKRLDEVSDYYRYRPERDELWKVRPAVAHAVMRDGKVMRIVVTDPGAGYSSPPKATIMDHRMTLEVTLRFSKNLKTNGSIASIDEVTSKKGRHPDHDPDQH